MESLLTTSSEYKHRLEVIAIVLSSLLNISSTELKASFMISFVTLK